MIKCFKYQRRNKNIFKKKEQVMSSRQGTSAMFYSHLKSEYRRRIEEYG